jgi:phage shock protein A
MCAFAHGDVRPDDLQPGDDDMTPEQKAARENLSRLETECAALEQEITDIDRRKAALQSRQAEARGQRKAAIMAEMGA